MKKIFAYTSLFLFLSASVNAQKLKDILKSTSKDSSSKGIGNVLKQVPGNHGLSNEDIVAGLKEALSVGTGKATQKVSNIDGFYKDAAIKILMPEEAQKVEKKLRSLGMGKQVDNAILSMNRAAEDAAKEAAPIFINAIKGMSFQDAAGILKGGDNAATNYLNIKTSAALTEAFRPIIESSLQKVDATKHWNTVFTTYNKFSAEKVNTDLIAYVTEKALKGIFHQLAQEEQSIRKDPVARTSEILKKVFGQ